MKTDFYIWGNNCKVLKLNQDAAEDVLDGVETTPYERELFWEGYFNGRGTVVVSTTIISTAQA